MLPLEQAKTGEAHWDGKNWTVQDGNLVRIILQSQFFLLIEGDLVEYFPAGENAQLVEIPIDR